MTKAYKQRCSASIGTKWWWMCLNWKLERDIMAEHCHDILEQHSWRSLEKSNVNGSQDEACSFYVMDYYSMICFSRRKKALVYIVP